jgi:hypothetical protein
MARLRRSPKNRLGGYNTRGEIWINKKIKGKDRKRVRKHEVTEIKWRKKGYSYKKAHAIAGKAETKGMSKKSILKYSGRLGAIARRSRLRH